MGLLDTLRLAHDALGRRGIDHALIGGLALLAHGVVRTTLDVDLLIDGERREDARTAFLEAGFTVFHESDDVLQLAGPGAVDCLFARRPPTRAMLAAARPVQPHGVRCVGAEGLIGLKLQAYLNDPRRELREKADIQALARARPDLDRNEVKRYADLFGQWPVIERLLNEA